MMSDTKKSTGRAANDILSVLPLWYGTAIITICCVFQMDTIADIEPYVVEAIKELIRGESFAKEIESRIGQKANTEAIDTELKNYKMKLIETETNKANLEETIDNLPLDIKYRERKLKDMSARLDSLYDTINELEEYIKDASLRRAAMEEEVLTLDNLY